MAREVQFGQRPYPFAIGNSPEAIANAQPFIEPTSKQLERYQDHGLTMITCGISFATTEITINTQALANPTQVWLKKRRPDRLTLVISSGKQIAPKKGRALELDQEKTLQAIRINLNYLSNRSMYEAEVTPVYSSQNTK